MMRALRRNLWHIAVASLAIIFGIVCVFPNLLQRLDASASFQGVEFMGADQEHYYAARVREMYDGYPQAGNVYREPKETPYIQPSFPERTIALFGRLFRMDAARAFIAAKALLGAALFFCFALFARSLSSRPWFALVSVTAILFAGSLVASPQALFRALAELNVPGDVLRFSRGVNPQWSGAWFFLAVFLLSSWMHRRRTIVAVAVGFCAVVLLYSYFYAWSYLGATILFLLLWCAWKRDWNRCCDLLLIGLIFLLAGIPYFLHLRDLLSHEWYAATSARQGLVQSREFVFGFFAFSLPLLAILARSLFPRTMPLLLSLGLGGILSLNQQLLTSQFLVPAHYHWYFIHPIAVVAFLLVFLLLLERVETKFRFRFLPHAITCLMIVAVVAGFLQQGKAYANNRATWAALQPAMPAYDFLSSYGTGTVLGNMQTSIVIDLLPVYTPLDTYDADNANNYVTPLERARHTFFMTMWLQGLSFEEASVRFFEDLRATLSGRLFGLFYREAEGRYEDVPDAIVAETLEAYEAFLVLPFVDKVRYPLDFALFTPFDERTPAWNEFFERGTVVFEQDGFAIIDLHDLSLPD